MCKFSQATTLTVGSLNVRGVKSKKYQNELADDMRKYGIDLLGIQESHLKGTGLIDIKTSDGKETYELFYTGKETNTHHGVGIVAKKDLGAEFKEISDRACEAIIQLESGKNSKKLNFISTYAPTLEVSEKDENQREEHYKTLEDEVKGFSKKM